MYNNDGILIKGNRDGINTTIDMDKFDCFESMLSLLVKKLSKGKHFYKGTTLILRLDLSLFNEKKIKKLNELLPIFKKKYKNRVNIKIDLVDSKGDKVNISSKADLYSNEYLVEKTVYELNWFNEENPENIVMEPLKFDGYCMRSIDEDAKYEELDKTNTKGKKPGAKKK